MDHGFDSSSITALLRQTDANLGSLRTPRRRLISERFSGRSAGCEKIGQVMCSPASEECILESPRLDIFDFGNKALPAEFEDTFDNALKLESQFSHWMNELESAFEHRLNSALQSNLSASDRKAQAICDQFRSATECLQTSLEGTSEKINLRIDSLSQELERVVTPFQNRIQQAELRELLSRLQTDLSSHDVRLQQCASIDDVSGCLRQAERSMQQRFDERLVQFEKQMGDQHMRLEARILDANKECQLLGSRIEHLKSQPGFIDALVQRVSDSSFIRELHEELHEQTCTIESQQRRLLALESKLPLLEAKAEVTESVIRQQLHERCNSTSGLNDMLQQVTASVTTTSQRVEASATQRCEAMEARFDAEVTALEMTLSARFLPHIEECRATQQHLVKSAEEAEARTRGRTESIHADLSRQLTALSEKTNKSLALVTGRVQDLERRKNDMHTSLSVLRADVLKNSDVTTHRFDSVTSEITALSKDLREQTLGAGSKHKRLVSRESRIECFQPSATGVKRRLAQDITVSTAPLQVGCSRLTESCSVVDTDEDSDTLADAGTGDAACVIEELSERFDEANQKNVEEIDSLKTTIGTIVQSFSTLDAK